MKVYVVTHGDYDDYRVDGVFSSRKKADEFTGKKRFEYLRKKYPSAILKDLNGTHLTCPPRFDYEVMEMDVDSLKPLVWKDRSSYIQPEDPNEKIEL